MYDERDAEGDAQELSSHTYEVGDVIDLEGSRALRAEPHHVCQQAELFRTHPEWKIGIRICAWVHGPSLREIVLSCYSWYPQILARNVSSSALSCHLVAVTHESMS